MATLRQYFETDFSNAVRIYVKVPTASNPIDAVLLYDYSAFTAYLACYVDGANHAFDYFATLVTSLECGKSKFNLEGKVILPSLRFFHGSLKIENKNPFEVRGQFFGDPTWVSSQEIQASRRLFIYSESDLTESEILQLKEVAGTTGHNLQFRSLGYMIRRTQTEEPLAFISHDSRDKEAVARRIAINLQRRVCPVWYDEFTLNVGDNLRNSIEKGLKECKKCILILS